jgi:hypothetical protein
MELLLRNAITGTVSQIFIENFKFPSSEARAFLPFGQLRTLSVKFSSLRAHNCELVLRDEEMIADLTNSFRHFS